MSLKRIVEKTWLAIFIVVALIFVIAYFKGDQDKIARILDADLRVLGLAVIAQIAYFFATIVTWQKALLYSTGRTVALRESLSQILLVNFGKYIPGKVWGIAARGRRLSESGYAIEEIARASYLEQILLLLTGFALALLAGALAFGNPLYWIGFAVAMAGIILFRHGDKVVAMLAQLIPKAGNLLRLFEVRISTGNVMTLSFGYVLVWLFLSCAFMLVCTSVIDVELTPTTTAIFVLSMTAGFLAGFLALFAPGGVGVREGVGAAFLTSVVSLEEAVLLMLLFRVWVVVAELVAGAVVLALPGSQVTASGNDIGG